MPRLDHVSLARPNRDRPPLAPKMPPCSERTHRSSLKCTFLVLARVHRDREREALAVVAVVTVVERDVLPCLALHDAELDGLTFSVLERKRPVLEVFHIERPAGQVGIGRRLLRPLASVLAFRPELGVIGDEPSPVGASVVVRVVAEMDFVLVDEVHLATPRLFLVHDLHGSTRQCLSVRRFHGHYLASCTPM